MEPTPSELTTHALWLSYYQSGEYAYQRDLYGSWTEDPSSVVQTIALLGTDPGASWWAGYFAAQVRHAQEARTL